MEIADVGQGQAGQVTLGTWQWTHDQISGSGDSDSGRVSVPAFITCEAASCWSGGTRTRVKAIHPYLLTTPDTSVTADGAPMCRRHMNADRHLISCPLIKLGQNMGGACTKCAVCWMLCAV